MVRLTTLTAGLLAPYVATDRAHTFASLGDYSLECELARLPFDDAGLEAGSVWLRLVVDRPVRV